MQRRRLSLVMAVSLFSFFIFLALHYYQFVTVTIQEESALHLQEVYHQAKCSLDDFVERNRNSLYSWVPYLRDTKQEEDIDVYLKDLQNRLGFTSFFFLSKAGDFVTLGGHTGYLDTRNELLTLFQKKEDVVMTSVIPGKPQMVVYAIPLSETGVYKGFSYDAIAISFTNEDFIHSIEVSTYSNQASTYLIRPDGRVIINSEAGDYKTIYNILAMLGEYSDIDATELSRVSQELETGQAGTALFTIEEDTYYLVYEALDIEGWIVLGIVPEKAVNASMNSLQTRVLIVVMLIGIIFCGFILLVSTHSNEIKMEKRDEELLYREELFEALSENVDEVFLMMDADTMKTDYISPNVERLTGISKEAVKQDIRCLYVLFKDSLETMTQVLEEGQIQAEWDKEMIHQNTGELRWFHVVAMSREMNGKTKYILVLSDRTVDKKRNEELRIALGTASRASKAKTIFLNNMSHDMRTPLNAVIGFANLAVDEPGNSPKVKEYLGKICSAGKHLLNLINDVLDMSRIESGKLQLEEAQVNLLDIFQNVKSIVAGQVHGKELEFSMNLEKLTDTKVYTDKMRLTQVLLNLLSNSIKYTNRGGKISMEAYQEGIIEPDKGIYVIRLKDNGIGMSKEFAARIFEPFERENNMSTRHTEGSGLGMPIAKSIVEMMDGSIQVQTQQGEGTEFVVRIILRQQILTLEEQRVLLVEGNPLNLQISMEILAMQGMIVDTALNGHEAAQKTGSANKASYDMILLDMRMKDQDVFETTREIRSLDRNAEKRPLLIAMATCFFPGEEERILEAGADGCLLKPLEPKELLNLVSGLSKV